MRDFSLEGQSMAAQFYPNMTQMDNKSTFGLQEEVNRNFKP
jgi:hypothetical protein